MTQVCKSKAQRVLLVEGPDDCHVVMALCAEHQIPETFGIFSCDNYEQVLIRANALTLSSERPTHIGILVDADTPNARARWTALQAKLKSYSFPPEPGRQGTILGGGTLPLLGVWIMPDNNSAGMLEDFLLATLDKETVAITRELVASARCSGITTFKDCHSSKALIHSYLAWQDEPGAPLGLSVTKRNLRPDTEGARQFTDFLRRLFCS